MGEEVLPDTFVSKRVRMDVIGRDPKGFGLLSGESLKWVNNPVSPILEKRPYLSMDFTERIRIKNMEFRKKYNGQFFIIEGLRDFFERFFVVFPIFRGVVGGVVLLESRTRISGGNDFLPYAPKENEDDRVLGEKIFTVFLRFFGIVNVPRENNLIRVVFAEFRVVEGEFLLRIVIADTRVDDFVPFRTGVSVGTLPVQAFLKNL
jgi:hypothetical protein